MAKSIILVWVIIFLFKAVFSEDQVTILQQYCSEKGDYDEGSIYQSNLGVLLFSLSSEASMKKFHNLTVGEGNNKVYGLFLCNGAFTNQVCYHCITVAAGQIQQDCPNQVEAILWYGQCMLRYANRNIFSFEDESVHFDHEYGPLRYKKFDPQVSSALIDLSKAVADQSSSSSCNPLAFATGIVYVADNIGLEVYVDCTPDLTTAQCSQCLQTGLDRLTMDGGQLGALVQPSCRLSFYFIDFSGKGHSFHPSLIGFIVIVVIAATSLVLIFCMCLRKSKARGKPTGMDEIESMENLHLEFNAIKAATDNFSSVNKIGQGGFGVVYVGTLPDGEAIAVKRLSSSSGQGIKEFKTEACLAAKLQHKNLVKLYGFCLEGEEKLLVYEFMPNKSLDRFLFDTKRGVYLKWEIRQKIVVGVARGLLYLHEDSRFKIIHCDLKPSNILLDGEMNPKISDFGMAKLFGVDQTQGNTSRIAGTFGYMAPEYAATGHFSVKSDVFSFGVILLEIVSGRRNSIFDADEQDGNLQNHAWRLWNEGDAMKLIDPSLGENYSTCEVTRCIHVGLLCVQEDAARRPAIASILSMLSNQSIDVPSPTPPPPFPYRTRIHYRASYESNARFTEQVFTNVHVR